MPITAASGPLTGIKVVELAGIGPAPFAAMVLADMGADVVRVDRADRVHGGDPDKPPATIWDRGRRSIGVDLKHPDGVGAVLQLVGQADALLEGFRPGVAERLGLGPDECLARNPRLAYGRMTGWGQEGPYAHAAGHDINYIALSGTLHAIGRRDEAPVPPLNLVGDFGGGGMLLALGICAALVEAARSGQGQVVDAAMVDGSAQLATMIHGMRAIGVWEDERGTNTLDTGAHFYEVYETADHQYVSIGSIEPQFYAELLRLTGLDGDAEFAAQLDRSRWPALKERLAAVFATKTRGEWCELMEGTDVCFAPVLSMGEAPEHPHNVARGT
ncbi:MAG TPA: CaiB/BaiF CoA-transferase family protein, partial [Acidimicrobiales bacterium]